MHDITSKSTALLLDELITATIKREHFAAGGRDSASVDRLKTRCTGLAVALDQRLSGQPAQLARAVSSKSAQPSGDSAAGARQVGTLIADLIETLLKCWQAQEVVMTSEDEKTVATAAKDAQHLNAVRNSLIRSIDAALGEESITVTEKTYS
jgi:hypothetical protein